MLKSYSRTQSTVALSSAEAELYATVTAASEGLGLAAMCEEYGCRVIPWINVDASAAIGIAQIKGLGKVRHLNTQSLWIQDAVRERRVQLEKVGGNLNPADLFTKHVPAEVMQRHMLRVGLCPQEGRAATAPKLVTGAEDIAMEVGEVELTVDSLEVDDDIVEEWQVNVDEGLVDNLQEEKKVSIGFAQPTGTPGADADSEKKAARLPTIRGTASFYALEAGRAACAAGSNACLGIRLGIKGAKGERRITRRTSGSSESSTCGSVSTLRASTSGSSTSTGTSTMGRSMTSLRGPDLSRAICRSSSIYIYMRISTRSATAQYFSPSSRGTWTPAGRHILRRYHRQSLRAFVSVSPQRGGAGNRGYYPGDGYVPWPAMCGGEETETVAGGLHCRNE